MFRTSELDGYSGYEKREEPQPVRAISRLLEALERGQRHASGAPQRVVRVTAARIAVDDVLIGRDDGTQVLQRCLLELEALLAVDRSLVETLGRRRGEGQGRRRGERDEYDRGASQHVE